MKFIQLFVLLVLFSITSCNKEKISLKNDQELIGDYEWCYSFGPNNASESFETITDKYAIRCKKSGRVEVYHNEVRVGKGNAINVIQHIGDSKILAITLNDTNAFVVIDGTEMIIEDYPIANHTNLFKKQ